MKKMYILPDLTRRDFGEVSGHFYEDYIDYLQGKYHDFDGSNVHFTKNNGSSDSWSISPNHYELIVRERAPHVVKLPEELFEL